MQDLRKTIILLVSIVQIGIVFSQNDSIVGNQRAFYECSDPIDADSTLIHLLPHKLYFQFNVNEKPLNLESMNFIWLKDTLQDYFTAYLVNMTDSTFSAKTQDGSLIMIQEALDTTGNWQPIEYWVYSGCGNSYFSPLSLDAGKCVMVPIKRYTGDYKTEIRLKLKYSKNVFYSESFEGSINLSQFAKESQNVNGILYRGPASYLDK